MKRALLSIALTCACAAQTASTSQPSASAGTSGAGTSKAATAGAESSAGAALSATLEGRSGSTLTGTARFTSAEGGVRAHVELQGATPGEHGLHVHEKGDCSDPKAASAGGHFNPGAAEHHGGPSASVRHGGDLGNITVDQSGKGTLDVTVQGLSTAAGTNGIEGRAIVVHEKADDLKSDPAGNSGARIGCGVIKAAAP